MARLGEWLLASPWRLPLLVALILVAAAVARRDLTQVDLGLGVLLIGVMYVLSRFAGHVSRQGRALAESLEREAATSKVLQVMSRSAFDLDAVFQAILSSAIHLCDADWGAISRSEGDTLELALQIGGPPGFAESLRRSRARPGGNSFDHRVLLEMRPIHVVDQQKEFPAVDVPADWFRTFLLVPMLRDDRVTGTIGLYRYDVAVNDSVVSGSAAGDPGAVSRGAAQPKPRTQAVPRGTTLRPFSEREIALVQTFADQAAIAIEIIRLFDEIQEKGRELELASKHKSDFLANMSHELRTPLNAIIGFSDVLGQKMFGELNEKQTDYLGDIASSGRHLLDLVNQILDLSKVEAGRMELEPSTFSPADSIRSSLAFVRERAAAHAIKLVADIPADLPIVTADERKIRQVVLNLLSNAVKFTPDGGVIEISARAAGGELEVSVKDTGIGIPPEDQAAVFEEFKQVGQRSDRSREGTGLGLTLAKKFVELHGGRIWVVSAVGTGSTFSFTIPLERPTPAASA